MVKSVAKLLIAAPFLAASLSYGDFIAPTQTEPRPLETYIMACPYQDPCDFIAEGCLGEMDYGECDSCGCSYTCTVGNVTVYGWCDNLALSQ